MLLDKKLIRKNQIEILAENFKKDDTKIEFGKLYQNLFENSLFKNAQSIGITLSSGFEMNTQPIIEKAWQLKKDVYIPKTYSEDHQMSFIKYTGIEELKKSAFGILEPSSDEDKLNPPDLIIVPGLAFSGDQNARVGFGGGYYDRYLQKYPTKTVSLVSTKQYFEHANWEIKEHDILIDELILPMNLGGANV